MRYAIPTYKMVSATRYCRGCFRMMSLLFKEMKTIIYLFKETLYVQLYDYLLFF